MTIERIQDGDKFTAFGVDYTLVKVDELTVNEFTVTVYHEQWDEEEEIVQDHFTVEAFEIDTVTFVQHGLSAQQLVGTIFQRLRDAGL